MQLLRNSFFQFIVCLVTLFLVELKKEFQATLKMSVVVSNNEGLGVGFLVSQNSHAYRVLFVKEALQFCEFSSYNYKVRKTLSLVIP